MKVPWAVIGFGLYAYVIIVLMFRVSFWTEVVAYVIIGWVFGNWAGQEAKNQKEKKKQ